MCGLLFDGFHSRSFGLRLLLLIINGQRRLRRQRLRRQNCDSGFHEHSLKALFIPRSRNDPSALISVNQCPPARPFPTINSGTGKVADENKLSFRKFFSLIRTYETVRFVEVLSVV